MPIKNIKRELMNNYILNKIKIIVFYSGTIFLSSCYNYYEGKISTIYKNTRTAKIGLLIKDDKFFIFKKESMIIHYCIGYLTKINNNTLELKSYYPYDSIPYKVEYKSNCNQNNFTLAVDSNVGCKFIMLNDTVYKSIETFNESIIEHISPTPASVQIVKVKRFGILSYDSLHIQKSKVYSVPNTACKMIISVDFDYNNFLSPYRSYIDIKNNLLYNQKDTIKLEKFKPPRIRKKALKKMHKEIKRSQFINATMQ